MKKILKISAIFIGLLIVLVVGLALSIDYILKSGIENTGSDMFLTKLSVESVNVSLFGGDVRFEGISIANPEGFDDGDSAMTIREIHLRMEPLSLFSDTIYIHELDVQMIDVLFEHTAETGRSNIGQLRQNLEAYSASSKPLDIAVVIDQFAMIDATLTIRTDIPAVETYTATIPRVELSGIGRDEETEVSEVMILVIEILLDQVTEQGLHELIEEGEQRLRHEAEDVLRNLLDRE